MAHGAVRIVIGDRHDDFPHRAPADAPFENRRDVDIGVVADHGRDDELVFGECFLGEDRPWEVHLAVRPPRLLAKRSNEIHEACDLIGRNRVAECGHLRRQSNRWSAVSDSELPVCIRLGRRDSAVSKVHRLDSDRRLVDCAAAINGVTARAPFGPHLGDRGGHDLRGDHQREYSGARSHREYA
jgi:hypothetical protein